MKYDIYLVGVGGQGVLTIGELIQEAALEAGISASFYPTKGMAQRGGFVKAQLRLGTDLIGPQIPERGADLAIAMEQSEALKAVPFIRPRGEFLLFPQVWQPTAVMLGKAPYPSLEQVSRRIRAAGATILLLDPASVPIHDGVLLPQNVYVLGAAVGRTRLGGLLDADAVAELVERRWRRGAERNRLAFQAGLEAAA